MSARVEAAVALLLLSAFAWFHQGGGWQQNARFDQIRALVETGRFSINEYIGYGPDHRRVPIPPSGFTSEQVPPSPHTGDLALADGWFYPNKPPGVTLLAAPGYALLRLAVGAFGISPDGPRAIEVLGWLTSVLSVGLLGAAAGVLFLRLGQRLFSSASRRSVLAATVAMSLGTPFLPYATMLFDHVPVAALLLLAFERLVAAADEGPTPGRLVPAGGAAGLAVVSNYAALLAVGVLAAYALLRIRPLSRLTPFFLAGLPFAAFLLAYHAVCFGDPFTIANSRQLDVFQEAPSESRLLSVFGLPDPLIALQLLASRYRGLFTAAPVLVLGFAGAFATRRQGRRLELATGLAIFLAYLALNASFNAWHGGSAFGPRYLVPAIPFVALGLVPAFARWPGITAAAAAVSIALCLTATAITPLTPQTVQRPWRDFLLPLARGERVERAVGAYAGPVSANLAGMGAPGREDAMNAFNVGEVVFPGRWWSLVPLLALQGAGWFVLLRRERAEV